MNKVAGLLLVLLFFGMFPSLAMAGGPWGVIKVESGSHSLLPKEERQHLRALELREHARENARIPLGYPDIYPNTADRTIDYLVLSHQIARLSALIQEYERRRTAPEGGGIGFFPPVPPGWAGPGPLGVPPDQTRKGEIASIYGPKGPNNKSVRLLLEYQLMVTGNPRLAIGQIVENEDHITAEIVTADGSLVEKYRIEKATGLWSPMR